VTDELHPGCSPLAEV